MNRPIYSVTEIRTAVEKVLHEHLPAAMAPFRTDNDEYGVVSRWDQTPTIEAISTAQYPAGAIASPGLHEPPTYSSSTDLWTTTWRIEVGIYDIGLDYDDTQGRIGNWCAGIKATLLKHRSLGGIAINLTPISEAYDYVEDRDSAQTIGAGSVLFAITAEVTTDPALTNDGDGNPLVTSTPTTVSTRP